LSDFEYLHPFPRYSLSKFEVVRNHAKFFMFLIPKIFWRRAPKLLDSIFKIQPIADHSATFHGDQLAELGDDSVAKNK